MSGQSWVIDIFLEGQNRAVAATNKLGPACANTLQQSSEEIVGSWIGVRRRESIDPTFNFGGDIFDVPHVARVLPLDIPGPRVDGRQVRCVLRAFHVGNDIQAETFRGEWQDGSFADELGDRGRWWRRGGRVLRRLDVVFHDSRDRIDRLATNERVR